MLRFDEDEFELAELSEQPTPYDLSDFIRDPFFRREIDHPVITPEGRTYDGKLIGGWIDKQHYDPISERTLHRYQLQTNRLFSSIKHLLKVIKCSREWRSHEDKLFSLFICPLSEEPFKEPVVAADGYTYEKAYLAAYLKKFCNTPMGGKQTTEFYPNIIVQQLMQNPRIKRLIERKSQLFDLDPTAQADIAQLNNYLAMRLKEDNFAGWQFGYCQWDKIQSATKLKHALEGKYSVARFFSQKDQPLHPALHQGRLKSIAEPALDHAQQIKKMR